VLAPAPAAAPRTSWQRAVATLTLVLMPLQRAAVAGPTVHLMQQRPMVARMPQQVVEVRTVVVVDRTVAENAAS
jgi:hypothetical protein